MNHTTLPYVSVIVPTYNAATTVTKCIESLLNQSYSQDRLELIFIDNESKDDTPQIVKAHSKVKYLESKGLKSPYPARNIGIQQARGSILAFTDANCYPSSVWIEEGVKMLLTGEADVVGGNVIFVFSKEKTAAEVYDSLTNVRIQENIKQRGVSKTANLLVHKYVIDQVGYFPSELRSGGDVIWTKKATTHGYRLCYSHEAVVYKYARKLIPLLRKQYRVGRGQSAIWQEQGEGLQQRTKKPIWSLLRLLSFRYPKFSIVRALIHKRGGPEIMHQANRIYWVAWLCRLATCIGQLSATVNPKRQHG